MKYLLMDTANFFILVHDFFWLYDSLETEIKFQNIINNLINLQIYKYITL